MTSTSFTIPSTTFSIGTSTTLPAESLVDKSLDDIIKARRQENKRRRGGIKASTNTQRQLRAQNEPTTMEKSLGKSKASRDAKILSKRGLQPSPKPTPMQIEKEVYRQKRVQFANGTNTPRGGGVESDGMNMKRRRRRNRGSLTTAAGETLSPTATTHVRTPHGKKADRQQQQHFEQRGKTSIGPPPKRAVNAAIAAMSQAGYTPPQGMQMVISFVEKNTNQRNTPKKE